MWGDRQIKQDNVDNQNMNNQQAARDEITKNDGHVAFLLIWTTFVDAVWLMFWFPYYQNTEMKKWNHGLHMTVCLITCLEIALKIIVFIYVLRDSAKAAINKMRQPK